MARVRNSALGGMALLLALTTAGGLQAQVPMEVGPDGEPTQPRRERASAFNLASLADETRVTINPGHPVEYCVENYYNWWFCPYGFGSFGTGLSFRNGTWGWGVPHSEWLKAKEVAPSLENVMFGRGWTVMANVQFNSLAHQIRPRDGDLGTIHQQVSSFGGGCTTLYGWVSGEILSPLNGCQQTIGSAGWLGAQEITAAMWQEYLAENPTAGFDFWKVPDAFAEGAYNPDRGLGSNQTYNWASDWTIEKAQSLGNVVPVSGVPAPPQNPGWPLGIEVRMDGFAFDLPSLRNVVFYQATFVNKSEEVYGVPLSYDSLYLAWISGAWFNSSFQASSAYMDLKNAAYKSTINGVNPNCNGATLTADISCFNRGDIDGAHAIVFLKSPIGDLRNKHFSNPESPLYDPAHPLVGDTITFNHHHMCGFRQCNQSTYQRMHIDPDGMQRVFGMLSSTPQNVLGSRTMDGYSPTGGSANTYWHTFRSETFQDAGNPVTFFNEYVVPGWNNSHGFDRVFLDPCGTRGCVVSWSDTLPNVSGGGYINAYNNTAQTTAFGPFSLAAGDSTGVIMGFITSPAPSGARFEVDAMVERVVDTYMNFFLSPKPAPPPPVRAVTVNTGAEPDDRSIELFLSLELLDFVDPFLASQAETFTADPLNEQLAAQLAERAEDNIRAIHVFKSCGVLQASGAVNFTTFTDDADCTGDPANDPNGRFTGIGWLPYLTFNVEDGLPTRVVDASVVPGTTYLYVIVAETRGAEFVVLSEDEEGTVVSEIAEFAPPLFNTLSANVDLPNVVSVRMPASLAAGARAASVAFVSQEGLGRVGDQGFEPLAVSAVGQNQVSGRFTLTFGDSVRVERPAEGSEGGTSSVTLYRGSSAETFSGPADLTLVGLGDPVASNGTEEFFAEELTAVLSGAAGGALLVTADLTGDAATPGGFVAASAFPGFFVSIDNRPGEFNTQVYVNTASGTVLTTTAQPSVRWNTAQAVSGPVAGGEYVIDWLGDPFGPNEPFQIDFGNPATTEAAVAASVAARASAGNSVTPSAEQVEQIVAALGGGDSALIAKVEAGEFRTASLPFTIRNSTTGEDVQVVLVERSSDVMALSNANGSIQIERPTNAWMPGDEMILLQGGDVAFARAVLDCAGAAPCNPAVQVFVTGATPAVYAGPEARHELRVQYFTGFDATTRLSFDVTPATTAGDIAREDIRESLRNVGVMPNPYLVQSSLDAAGGANRIAFTGLPPSGQVRIYSLTGQFLQLIAWGEGDLPDGDLLWDMRTFEGNLVASGLYLFVVDAMDGSGATIGQGKGKFVIIR